MHISYGCLTLNLLCYVICSRPPQVDVHHGNCTLPDRGVATGAASSVAGKTNAGVAVSVAQSADVCPGGGGGIHVFVSLCLSPGSPLLCQVQDLLLACLQQFLEHAAHCGVLQCSPKSLYWYSELSCRACRHLYISAEGDLGVFCPKQVDRRCLWGFDRLQYGAHGQASAVWVAWAACTL